MEISQSQDISNQIESLRGLLENKPLSFSEACIYLNFSASYLYKLTHRKAIPHYKPNGKKVFFDRAQLDGFLRQRPVLTISDHLEAIEEAKRARKASQARKAVS